ncbi:MAG: hypothetical protein JWN86_2741 [Planctomycetota bacterium]|nr:hypothetical protein [Planctomycetota bacterium]
MSIGSAPRIHTGRLRNLAAVIGLVSLVGCFGLALRWPTTFYPAYLVAYLFWAGIAIGCIMLLMLHYLVGGEWGLVLRRPMEAGAMTILPMAILFIPIGLGLTHLYPWADLSVVHANEALRRKSGYLNPTSFQIRSAGYLAFWIIAALLLNRWSSDPDRTDDSRPTIWLERLSGPGLVFCFLAATFAMIDWVMSLEPEWASTIYGVMLIVGHGLAAFAMMTAVAAFLVQSGPLRGVVSRETLADCGNLLLAFVMLWAYMAFAQFMIIWSGNLAEEIPWYVRRSRGGWQWIATTLIVFHFFAPFVILLFHEAKRRPGVLIAVAGTVVALHFVDVCWLTLPARFEPRSSHIPWDQVGMALVAAAAVGGVFIATFADRLGRRPLYPARVAAINTVARHPGTHGGTRR